MRYVLCLALFMLVGNALALDDALGYGGGNETNTVDAYSDGAINGYDSDANGLDETTESPEDPVSFGASSSDTTSDSSELLSLDQTS